MRHILDYAEEEHSVRLMVGDPKALAFEWMKAYARNLSEMSINEDEDDYSDDNEVTVEDLIHCGKSALDPSKSWFESISRGGAFEGYEVDAFYWDKLAILLDIDIPENKRNNFFSCSC